MAICPYCNEEVMGQGAYLKHRWDRHPEIAQADLDKAIAKRKENQASRLEVKNKKRAELGLPPLEPKPKGEKNVEQQEQSNNGNSKPQSKPKEANTFRSTMILAEANKVTISPRAFSMASSLLWTAMQAAISEWGWPGDMSPEDFLDTYLYLSFKQRGIVLGGYQVLPAQDRENGHDKELITVGASEPKGMIWEDGSEEECYNDGEQGG